mmetsp:Transcript_4808/g.20434  ORF Transcript_4808/g.20434 Transcript_4808/m.20434 type:complete len:99 (+) Transcript_4808:2513-2809(+)
MLWRTPTAMRGFADASGFRRSSARRAVTRAATRPRDARARAGRVRHRGASAAEEQRESDIVRVVNASCERGKSQRSRATFVFFCGVFALSRFLRNSGR